MVKFIAVICLQYRTGSCNFCSGLTTNIILQKHYLLGGGNK